MSQYIRITSQDANCFNSLIIKNCSNKNIDYEILTPEETERIFFVEKLLSGALKVIVASSKAGHASRDLELLINSYFSTILELIAADIITILMCIQASINHFNLTVKKLLLNARTVTHT